MLMLEEVAKLWPEPLQIDFPDEASNKMEIEKNEKDTNSYYPKSEKKEPDVENIKDYRTHDCYSIQSAPKNY